MLFCENGAWNDIIVPPLGNRRGKPRQTGLTMVIDKGLGLSETKDLLETAAGYIDLLKLGFGTSAFTTKKFCGKKFT